ncbi:FGGY-family carbohydrate kinase [candidate division KSB1 bacterium]|nr:FGGY-family carbohydrate kinase [candidate division KSB1 bacterium]
MTDKYIVAHDLGTSSNKAVLVSVFGNVIGVSKQSYPIYHPNPGFAEQDPEDWWCAICTTTRDVIKRTGVNPEDVVGLTFSAQMQGLVAVDHKGQPLMRGITWLDSRGSEIIHKTLWKPPRILGYNIFNLLKFLRFTGGSPGQAGKDIIGKLLWIKENLPDVFEQTHKFLDIKDYLIHRLTGNFTTSVDIAVVWWLCDTRNNRNQWHPGLCKLAGVTPEKLAKIDLSNAIAGKINPSAASEIGLAPGTSVINGAGDLSSAGIGSGAIHEGELHISIGTSGWVAGHFSKRKIDIPHYTGCIGSAHPEQLYMGMAHQETAGACLEWIRKLLINSDTTSDADDDADYMFKVFDEMVAKVPAGADGMVFTPWLFGERCPLDDDYVRSGFHNLSLRHTQAHLLRAVFEGIAFNTRWAMNTLENLYQNVKELSIIGGGAKSAIWCQIMADVMDRTIHQIEHPQLAGAKGMALLASVALGFIPTFDDIKTYIQIKQTYHPNPEHRALYDRLFQEFKNIYRQNKTWYKRMNKNTGTQNE